MIKSMTAFARSVAHGTWGQATIEIRCVNHRFLDCVIRMPETLRDLEPKLRDLIRSKVSRGRVECFLKYQPGTAQNLHLTLNTPLIEQLVKAKNKVAKIMQQENKCNPMQILSWNNVVQINEHYSATVSQKITSLAEKTITKLLTAKQREGMTIKKLLLQRLRKIQQETSKIKKIMPAVNKQYRENLLARLQKLPGEVDHNRLEQEIIYLIHKSDIAEELDRLTLHTKEIIRLLNSGGVLGKRIDFIIQELNREANTMAAKAANKKITAAAIELKVLIEEMREQVQNIE